LLLPLVVGNLTSGDLPRQLVGALVLFAILVPVSIIGAALVWRAVGPVRRWLRELTGRAAAHRHREALAALRAVPLWSALPSGRLLEVARAMHALEVALGDEIVRQGDQGDHFYLIAMGSFEVQVDGRAVGQLGPGDFFGERALL